jgi:hypothetical protein
MNRREEDKISAWDDPSLVDPRYMKGDLETPEFTDSTDDRGGTEKYYSGTIGPLPLPRRGSYHKPGETRRNEE